MQGKLVLEDGTVFNGFLIGDSAFGEVVFNTGMEGYQDILTDPSYCTQIITLTYPLVGNYGVNRKFNQSRRSFASALICAELCTQPSGSECEAPLETFLAEQKVPCLTGIDTRALTIKLRSAGTMKGGIFPADTPQAEIDRALAQPLKKDVVARTTCAEPYTLNADSDGKFVAVYDFGIKRNILDSLVARGARVIVLPASTTAEDCLKLNPDLIFLSNGPGDPADVPEITEQIKILLDKKPIFGICLGHQLIARALGAKTFKLKFGHRGVNQPVKFLDNNRCYITSQNHGYAVDADSLAGLPLDITCISLNDGTIEGLKHHNLPVECVQFHPEASPGPNDCAFMFDRLFRADD